MAGAGSAVPEARGAVAEVNTLKGIQSYIEMARATIRVNGNVATVISRKLPMSLLEVERRRMRAFLRWGQG